MSGIAVAMVRRMSAIRVPRPGPSSMRRMQGGRPIASHTAAAQACARHPSQLYQAALEGLLLGVVLTWLAFRRGWLKRPGALMGLFLLGYGIARFLVEFVRQPDAQFVSPGNPVGLAVQVGGYGLTMGQLLSLPMIAVGLYFLLRARIR